MERVGALEASEGTNVRRLVGHGLTRYPNCVAQIVQSIVASTAIRPESVRRIYSEWEPTRSDLEYLERNFHLAEITYSFARPADDSWEVAFEQARLTMVNSAQRSDSRDKTGEWIELAVPENTVSVKKWWQFWR